MFFSISTVFDWLRVRNLKLRSIVLKSALVSSRDNKKMRFKGGYALIESISNQETSSDGNRSKILQNFRSYDDGSPSSPT